MVHGESAPFTKIPNGMPGLELRMPLLYSAGVRTGRITLAQFVALTATNPARIYGLYPRKGAIAPGSDADLAIWDTGFERVVAQADLHDAMDDSPFEGRSVTGWPVTTIARGEVVWHEGQVAGGPGRGRFVARTSRFHAAAGSNFASTVLRLVESQNSVGGGSGCVTDTL